jgi:hypothetical protein
VGSFGGSRGHLRRLSDMPLTPSRAALREKVLQHESSLPPLEWGAAAKARNFVIALRVPRPRRLYIGLRSLGC